MATSKELALKVIKRLAQLDLDRKALNDAYGDDRGAFYEGNKEEDLKALAQQVLKEHKS